jgi:hypothetical protein
VAAVYAGNPKVAATAAAGSVGSGLADEWSDLELDVYWHAPPTDDDRRHPIDVLGGDIEQYWPYTPTRRSGARSTRWAVLVSG